MRVVVYLIAAACVFALLWEKRPKQQPTPVYFRTCTIRNQEGNLAARVPCKDLDDWRGTQWDI